MALYQRKWTIWHSEPPGHMEVASKESKVVSTATAQTKPKNSKGTTPDTVREGDPTPSLHLRQSFSAH